MGGIFFDYLDSGVWNDDMEFVKNIGTTFTKTYKSIVNDAAKLSWNDNDKNSKISEDPDMLNLIFYTIEELNSV